MDPESQRQGSSETTPLLFPPIKPLFSYSAGKKKSELEGNEDNDDNVATVELLKRSGKLGPGTKAGGWKRYFGIILALLASFLLSLTTLIAKVLIEYHPFNEAMWRFQGILLPSIPIIMWSKLVKKEDIFETITPLYKSDKLVTFLVLFVSVLD